MRDVQEAASHAGPRTTMRYDRARGSLDRHATYIVAAYVAGAARQTSEGWELFRLAAIAARRKVTAVIGHDRSLNLHPNRDLAPEPGDGGVTRDACRSG